MIFGATGSCRRGLHYREEKTYADVARRVIKENDIGADDVARSLVMQKAVDVLL